ncbi:MAG: VCBS repeat-containing protein [Planctomycetota bacterium]
MRTLRIAWLCLVPVSLTWGLDGPITTLKPLHRETPVVLDGKAQAVILVPNTDVGRQAGRIIAERVRAVSSVDLPVTSDPAQADLKTLNVIALGNLLDNPVIERLYWNRYSFADKLYPGPAKFTLRSVCNPYPYASGKNAFLVEASDDEGMLAGAEELARRIAAGKDVVLPWTLYHSAYTPPTPEKRAELRKDLKLSTEFRGFHAAVQRYLRTPDPTQLDMAKLALDAMCRTYEEDPKHHLTWPDETTSEWIMPSWDAVEESDEFSDAERLRYTNLLLLQLRSQPQHIFEYKKLEEATSITWNHITFPLMGLYFSARYFRAYYPDVDRDEIALYFKKIETCFKGQETCWKAREDSAGYVDITPRHMMMWSLAENRRTWFEKGFPLRLAQHLMACGDPMGYTAGHGDHPIARSPSDEREALPLCFYLSRDARLLWRLNQLYDGAWPNPYWQDVAPTPPTEMVGLYIDPMHPEYYRWSDNLSVYGTAAAPHNVPLEKSFDKLTMRNGLTPESQYLVLDGFGRGFHLHYDTNMIIKYTYANEVLLMDHDYLVRNTTEHNGLSVVRNGRAEALIPTLAALEAMANLPGCLMARTSVRDYNGIDWHRTILMVKGGPVAVLDEAAAKQPGNYTLWCVWKTLDEDKEEITDSQTYRLFRPGCERLQNPYFTFAKLPEARGGEALVFDKKQAARSFEVNLPRGTYSMTLRAYATTGGNDSLWVKLDDQEKALAFHVPKDAFGEAKGTWDLTEPAPKIDVPKNGTHRFHLSLREGPGLVLDTIQIADAAGKMIFDQRALDIVAPKGERVRIPDHRFYVVNTGGSALQLSPWVNANREAVKRLRQIANVKLDPAQSYVYQNLLASTFDKPDAPQVKRLSDRAFAARIGEEDFLFGIGDPEKPEAYGPLSVVARAFVLSKDKLWLMDGREVNFGGKSIFRSDQPEDKEIEWKEAPAAEIVGAFAPAPSLSAAGPAPDAGQVREAWYFKPDVELYREGPEFLETADLNGDGRDEIFYGVGNTMIVLDAAGKELWRFAATDRVRSCAVADLNKDGKPEVLVGSNDEHVHVLDATGAEIRSWKCAVELISGQGHGRYPYVQALAVSDINGDGNVEVLAGTCNCWLIAYTTDGNELWKDSGQYHGVRRIIVADINNDQKPEILSANRYGGIRIYDGAGKRVWGTTSELGDVSMALGRTKPGPLPTVVNGSSTGVLTAKRHGEKDNDFTFNNYGFGVNEVVCADVNRDGLDEALVASETGYVYCLNGRGEEVWRAAMGSVVRDVAAGDMDGDGGPEVLCGIEDGSTHVLSGGGASRGGVSGDSPVARVATCRKGDGIMGLAAGRNGVLKTIVFTGK